MKLFLGIIICLTIFSSCGMQDDFTKEDSPTTGKLTLFFDEGLTLHIQNQIYTFRQTYQHAIINVVATNEKQCIEALFNDSCKAIAITRELSKAEIEKFKIKNIVLQTSIVAKDAIAFVVSKNFTDSTLSLTELKQLLIGNDSSYIKNQHINLVFDNQNSGCTRQLKDSLIPIQAFGLNCSAKTTTKQLMQHVAANTNVIGICDYAWLSDKDDSTTKEFLKSIKILAISKTINNVAYMPDQSNIATNDYPLCRTICIIRRSGEFTLSKGIETFIAGEKGQLMFLKQGLPPNRQEERVVQIDMTPLK